MNLFKYAVVIPGATLFGGFVLLANLAPNQINEVPVISSLTPVYAQWEQLGVTEWKFTSHSEVHASNRKHRRLREMQENAMREYRDAMDRLSSY